MHRITLIPGDGIGPEVASAVVRIIEASGVEIEWERHVAGQEALDKFGSTLPAELLESIKRNKVGLKGPITTPVGKGFTSVNVGLRKALHLYANLRPIRALPNIPCRNPDLNLVIVRENTESLYSGIEHEVVPGVIESLKIITDKASTMIARFAFEFAKNEQRKKITCTHKANIMKMSDGLFIRSVKTVAAGYPEIAHDTQIIDAACMNLVMTPERFDVLVLPNMYGDLVAELGAGLIGGTGVAPGAHFGGADGRELAVFEATHGTATHLAGTNRADPIGLIISGAMLLRHVGETDAGNRLEAAVASVLADGTWVTYDLRAPTDDRPAAGTFGVADAIITLL
jgi:isocitrate dehydrogenase (NAD+)